MKIKCWLIFILLLSACSTQKNWNSLHLGVVDGLHDIELIDTKTAISYSYGTGNLYKTTDRGQQWDRIYQFDAIYFEQIQFVDFNSGWLIPITNKERTYIMENGSEQILIKMEEMKEEIFNLDRQKINV